MASGAYEAHPLPGAFIWRRLHSLLGLWLVLFLIEHLLTNSQAALLIGDDGNGFINAVNGIKNLPYLQVIEVTLLGVPLFIHGVWGVKYLFTAQSNSWKSDGTIPSLGEYGHNHAYTWQRITSWVLLVGIILHVVQMRFIEYPASAKKEDKTYYMVRVTKDDGLHTLAPRLGFVLYNRDEIEKAKAANPQLKAEDPKVEAMIREQARNQQQQWLSALQSKPLASSQIMAVSDNFGVAELLMVRDTFKSPLMMALYTILVLATTFHAFNGLWTFLITWGVTLTASSQRGMYKLCAALMALISFLGVAAIFGTYWINLRH